MKHRLVVLFSLVLLFSGISASISSAGPIGKIGTEDTCAASFGTESAYACGNQSYRWYALDSSPPGGYYVGHFLDPCSYSQYGWITYIWNGQYRYTVQCRQA